ncbi:outer membrane protein assembly factor BamE domain-containing protein [Herminiimonas arsenitoxidans]|uniref:outer membrane protein assembly factor BamE domain-containing protein n=1 Tax=Herminiimonas arsenitoxidans TaxID=1809410 RepID=UPI000970CA60|nr:outer membrane protein assembly factor BamE [Herminiimonas arsenitoxidans]
MKYSQKAILGGLLLMLSACAVLMPPPISVGEPEASIVAKLGRPSARIEERNGYLLEYTRNPWGQATDMARFDRNGNLVSYEQVLTVEKFATIKPGIATKEDVLRTVGHPSETSYLSRLQLEVWSYPYKEAGVWNSVMHVHFDNNGIVKMMQNGQDLRFERDGMFGSGRL